MWLKPSQAVTIILLMIMHPGLPIRYLTVLQIAQKRLVRSLGNHLITGIANSDLAGESKRKERKSLFSISMPHSSSLHSELLQKFPGKNELSR